MFKIFNDRHTISDIVFSVFVAISPTVAKSLVILDYMFFFCELLTRYPLHKNQEGKQGLRKSPRWRAQNGVKRSPVHCSCYGCGCGCFNRLLCFRGCHHRPLPLTQIFVSSAESVKLSSMGLHRQGSLARLPGLSTRAALSRLIFFLVLPTVLVDLASYQYTKASPSQHPLHLCDLSVWSLVVLGHLLLDKDTSVPSANVRASPSILCVGNI